MNHSCPKVANDIVSDVSAGESVKLTSILCMSAYPMKHPKSHRCHQFRENEILSCAELAGASVYVCRLNDTHSYIPALPTV